MQGGIGHAANQTLSPAYPASVSNTDQLPVKKKNPPGVNRRAARSWECFGNFLQSSPLKRSKIRHLVPVGLCSRQLLPSEAVNLCFLTLHIRLLNYGLEFNPLNRHSPAHSRSCPPIFSSTDKRYFKNSAGFSLIGKCPRPFMMVTSRCRGRCWRRRGVSWACRNSRIPDSRNSGQRRVSTPRISPLPVSIMSSAAAGCPSSVANPTTCPGVGEHPPTHRGFARIEKVNPAPAADRDTHAIAGAGLRPSEPSTPWSCVRRRSACAFAASGRIGLTDLDLDRAREHPHRASSFAMATRFWRLAA